MRRSLLSGLQQLVKPSFNSFLSAMSDRYIINPYPDYDGSATGPLINESNGQIMSHTEIEGSARSLLRILEANITSDRSSSRDDSVYTGIPGYAYLYYFLFKKTGDRSFLEKSLSYSKSSLNLRSSSTRRRISFMCGDPGILSISAVIFNSLGQKEQSLKLIQEILSLLPFVTDLNSGNPDEILYGRSGYLFSLLFLRRELGSGSSVIITDDHLRQVISAIITSGIKTSSAERRTRGSATPPLYYYWHDSVYIGAAHGFSGILYMLLKCHQLLTRDELTKLVRPTVDWLISLRFPSGNTPSSIGSERDRLVHWCHGAPGLISTFIESYKVFQDSKYLDAAETSSDVVWNRGLLLKGYGVCHGISGNGYSFLSLYRLTFNAKYLYRGLMFADFCRGYGAERGMRTPDAPFSLFEGLAGCIHFMFDILNPKDSLFPAYEL